MPNYLPLLTENERLAVPNQFVGVPSDPSLPKINLNTLSSHGVCYMAVCRFPWEQNLWSKMNISHLDNRWLRFVRFDFLMCKCVNKQTKQPNWLAGLRWCYSSHINWNTTVRLGSNGRTWCAWKVCYHYITNFNYLLVIVPCVCKYAIYLFSIRMDFSWLLIPTIHFCKRWIGVRSLSYHSPVEQTIHKILYQLNHRLAKLYTSYYIIKYV